MSTTYKLARRIVITVLGGTVLLAGIVMIVAPGPATLVIPIGLAILAVEFAWARLWLRKLRKTISNQNRKNHGERAENHRRR